MAATRRAISHQRCRWSARYDVDGINPIFNRGAPFLLYETPLLEEFREQTGLDARELDERDPRHMAYHASVMTDFMRELRARCRKPLSAHVLNDLEERHDKYPPHWAY